MDGLNDFENQFQLKNILNALFFCAYIKDQQGRFILGNNLLLQHLNLTSSEQINRKSDFDMPWINLAREIENEDLLALQNGKEIKTTINNHVLYRQIIRDDFSKPIGLLGMYMDIVPSVRDTELEEIIALMPGHVFWKNTKCILQGCNNNQAIDSGLRTRRDIVGKTAYDLLWQDQPEEEKHAQAAITDKIDLDIMRNDQSESIEEFVVAPDGSKIYYWSTKTPLHNKDGQVTGLLGISLDITDRKKIEEELKIAKEKAEAASHAKTEFIANMGHDIRTPLTGIIGFSQYLAEEIQNPERRTYARQICESGEQLLGLLNGVLDLITADSLHEDHLIQESFDLRHVIQDVLQLELPAVKARHIEIKEYFDETVPQYVMGDKMKLHRILLNLVGNAIKFTEKGYIELSIRLLELNHNTTKLIFAVKDTGIGIPDNLQNKVFDRFFKVSPSYKGIYTGNGIGLHIAQKYVELMGGNIELQSILGVGTTFSFVLSMKLGEQPTEEKIEQHPITEPKAPIVQPTKVVAPPITPCDSKRSLRVLLVEDNGPAMVVLKMMVNKFDVSISSAVDAESAFELIQKQPFDILITDLGLPSKQGDELSKMIRIYEQQQSRKPMKIVALTGHAVGEISRACIEAGMNEVYRKPMTHDALQKLLTPLIAEKQESLQQPKVKVGLGPDLPEIEAKLFEIDKYPLFDPKISEHLLGSMSVVHDIFKTFKQDGIDADLIQIKVAHEKRDWAMVQKLAHKMKGGALYGTVRLHYALQYMERYLKAGHTKCVEQLFAQMLKVIDETLARIDNWLKDNR